MENQVLPIENKETEQEGQGNQPSRRRRKRDNLWYSRVEKMLFLYPTIDQAIKRLEAIIIQIDLEKFPSGTTNYKEGPPSTGDIMSSTERYAYKRIAARDRLQAKIDGLKAQKEAVGAVYARLGDEEKELVRKWYFEDWKLRHPEIKIWDELHIDRRNFFRKKDRIVHKIAVLIGELPI